jgi:uncharacterized protein with von Willebrand factor type A (vWA) domain
MQPLVFEVDDISKGFFADYTRKRRDADAIFNSCDYRLFNLKRLSLEVFHRLFREPYPEPIETARIPPENRWALHVHEKLSAMPDFDILLDRTDSNFMLAGAAAMEFIEKIAERLPKPETRVPDPGPLREEVKRLRAIENPGPGTLERIKQLTEEGKKAVAKLQEYENALEESHTLRNALLEGVRSASESTEALAAAGNVLGWNTGDGSDIQASVEEKMALSNQLMQNRMVRKIFEIAGRMLETAAQKRRSMDPEGMGELAGVSLGNDLARLLPGEFQKLAFPEMSDLFYLQYLDKTLMEYEVKGKTEQGKGPLVLCVDISGSMNGMREIWAKALVLTMMKLARQDKRQLRIVLFAGSVRKITDVEPFQASFADVMEQIAMAYNGSGTDFIPPLRSALSAIERQAHLKKADIVFLTDGECSVTPQFLEAFNAKKTEMEFTVYGINVGVHWNNIILAGFCDQVILINDLESGQQLESIF